MIFQQNVSFIPLWKQLCDFIIIQLYLLLQTHLIHKTSVSQKMMFWYCFEVDDVLKKINKLSNRKAIQSTDIPVKILKQNADIFGNWICYFFNVCVDKGTLSSVRKHPNITPVFKKGYRVSKETCRLVSILLVISKIFVKLLCNQISPFVDQFLSKYQCGFRRGLSAQHYLLAMLKKWKKAVDTKKVFVAFVTDP